MLGHSCQPWHTRQNPTSNFCCMENFKVWMHFLKACYFNIQHIIATCRECKISPTYLDIHRQQSLLSSTAQILFQNGNHSLIIFWSGLEGFDGRFHSENDQVSLGLEIRILMLLILIFSLSQVPTVWIWAQFILLIMMESAWIWH